MKSVILKKVLAFTLAETLIAIMIIGLVAALTIPVFTANMHGKAYRTKYLKTVAVLTQASTASYANDDYDFSGVNGYYGSVGAPVETYNLADGAADGSIFGNNTQNIQGNSTYSDLHVSTNSLFNLFKNNLQLMNSSEISNYAVGAVDLDLNCAGRATDGQEVTITSGGNPGITSANIINNLDERLYKSSDVTQGSGGLANLCDGRVLADGGINQGRMFQLQDGAVFTYDPSQAYCLESNPCYGYIDVNGPEGPNRVIACTDGEDSFIATYGKSAAPGTLLADCSVQSTKITDIFPVLFYNQTIKPASWAAKSVHYGLESNQVNDAQANNTEN